MSCLLPRAGSRCRLRHSNLDRECTIRTVLGAWMFMPELLKMDRKELLSLLVRAIVSRKAEGRPLKVAIDGRSAAGKSTLADELGALISALDFHVLCPSVDGFHHPRERRYPRGEFSAQGYYDCAYNYEEVVDTLLKPLSGDTFPVLCRQISIDLRTDLPTYPPSVSVSARTILLFEGIFVFRKELNPYWDYRILLDVDPATALLRGLARDTIRPPDVIRRRYERRYDPAWEIHLKTERPESKADVIVDNRDVSRPRILKPMCCA